MKFLLDHQLPPALAGHLRQRGFDSVHVLHIGLHEASDIEIYRYAIAHEYVIVSKDEDFFFIASQPSAQANVVWVRLGNCRTKTLLAAFDRSLASIESSLQAGQLVVELR